MKLDQSIVVMRGGGDLGTGAALRLQRAGWRVLIIELAQPLAIRRAVAFATAIYDGSIEVEDTIAQRIEKVDEADRLWALDRIPVIVDVDRSIGAQLNSVALIDAIMAKHNTGTRLGDAPIVVALGPGFVAGVDCHAVVETNRGHNLGRVYYRGPAETDTDVPGQIGGENNRRVLRAPTSGVFHAERKIGEVVKTGEVIGYVGSVPLAAQIDGVLRGMLADGLFIAGGTKVADIDPRGNMSHCFSVSDKAWAVGGGVLEAVLYLARQR